jgi:hypothetical protein
VDPARKGFVPVLGIARAVFQGMPNRSFDTLIGDLPPMKIACRLVLLLPQNKRSFGAIGTGLDTTVRVTRTCHLERVAPMHNRQIGHIGDFTERSCPGPSRLRVALHTGARDESEGSRTGRLSVAKRPHSPSFDKTNGIHSAHQARLRGQARNIIVPLPRTCFFALNALRPSRGRWGRKSMMPRHARPFRESGLQAAHVTSGPRSARTTAEC